MILYSFSIFTSKNTAIIVNIEARNFASAKKIARLKSLKNPFPVMVTTASGLGSFAKYDHGELVEWNGY